MARRRRLLPSIFICAVALVLLAVLDFSPGAVADGADSAPAQVDEQTAVLADGVGTEVVVDAVAGNPEPAVPDAIPNEPVEVVAKIVEEPPVEPVIESTPAPSTQDAEAPVEVRSEPAATKAAAKPKAPAPKSAPTPVPVPVKEPEEEIKILPHIPDLMVTEFAAQVVGDDKRGKVQRITPPATIKQLTADGSSTVKLRFSAADASLPDKPLLKVHQAFVVFRDAKGEHNEVVLAATQGDADGKYTLDVDFSNDKTRARFHHLSSTYTLTVLLGSFTSPRGYSWSPGSLQLNLPDADAATLRPKVLPGQPDPVDYAVKPEIRHVFRPPQKLPPSIVSLAATAAVLVVPWGFLLWAWSSLSISPRIPPASLVPHAAFLVTLGLFYVLLWAYWTVLNLGQLLGYLAVLTPVTALTGRLALSEVAARRTAKGKEKKKA
ncbi:hypothetical protein M427DRAFT_41442 [Gonapodya prolifera JEL478]|uniref:Ribophorin II n=1 Tax=Gonapodya prolifera (strain JEL478) TaxID=1344416 RepID=A0A139ATN9_GONPJ|nr:hypothetical protein M427DRAFT_41442 [Gonapodya prolifera JEL478]|eukprot:KXS20100.1 hypothetical protein M427DRAFT_41442 [Gonapodya prolifera JEL478]